MATVLLVRHARTGANAGGVLAGWTPGVALDDTGVAQAVALGGRMAGLPLATVVTSPLERCRQTAEALLAGRGAVPVVEDERLAECRYGDWTGRTLKSLARERLWRVVQAHPSAAVFPGAEGESLRAMQSRAVDAVRDWDAKVSAEHGPEAVWVAVSHGDVIKSVLAEALGCHLDEFQRIVVDPCSVSAVRYTELRPFVVCLNDVGGDLSRFAPRRRRRSGKARRQAASSDAPVGGGAGGPSAP